MPATTLQCPHCHQSLHTSKDGLHLVGVRVKCRKCGQAFVADEGHVLASAPVVMEAVVLPVPLGEGTFSVVAAPGPQPTAVSAGPPPLTPPVPVTHRPPPLRPQPSPYQSGNGGTFLVVLGVVGVLFCLALGGAGTLYVLWSRPTTTPAAPTVASLDETPPVLAETQPQAPTDEVPPGTPPAPESPPEATPPEPVQFAKAVPPAADPQPPEVPRATQVLQAGYEIKPNPASTLTADQQQRVNEAIERGVRSLRENQGPQGTWQPSSRGQLHAVGYAALPGLTLLECGVPANDPAVQRAAAFVRADAPALNNTYCLSLAVLFLDRLGDKADRPLIQALALRLVAGQTLRGGWSYSCPVLSVPEQQQLLTFLRSTRPLPIPLARAGNELPNPLAGEGVEWPSPLAGQGKDGGLPAPLGKKGNPGRLNGLEGRGGEKAPGLLMPFEPGQKQPGGQAVKTDPDGGGRVPTGPDAPDFRNNFPVNRLSRNLQTLPIVKYTPSLKNRWGQPLIAGGHDDNSNTQFALMALWAARRHEVPMERTIALAEHRFRGSQNRDGGWGYVYGVPGSTGPMTCVGLLGLAMGHGSYKEIVEGAQAKAAVNENGDPAITAALRHLGGEVGQAPADWDRPGNRENLYFLWSLERVAVLYNLKTIGDRDWYAWAAHLLVTNQQREGGWGMGGYHGSNPTIDTSLALLVLKRANLVQDLTESLRMYIPINDPARTR